MFWLQTIESVVAEARLEMQSDDALVAFQGACSDSGRCDVREPVIEPVGQQSDSDGCRPA